MNAVKTRSWVAPSGRHVAVGQEVTVFGIGRCRFRAHVTGADGSTWVELIELRSGNWRMVAPERVTRVHRLVEVVAS